LPVDIVFAVWCRAYPSVFISLRHMPSKLNPFNLIKFSEAFHNLSSAVNKYRIAINLDDI
jgi:hypothetical protein